MRIERISTQLLFSTTQILVEREAGGTTSGTGFFFSLPHPEGGDKFVPLIVTNAHVVRDVRRGVFEVAVDSGNGIPMPGEKLRIEFDQSTFAELSDDPMDIAAAPIASILERQYDSNKRPFLKAIDANLVPSAEQAGELDAIEEITFFGYPSGLRDMHNSTPLIRRGITSTPFWNDFQGEQKFVVDAGVYPGSSGSPVFLYNEGSFSVGGSHVIGSRLLFLGMLSNVAQRRETAGNVYLGLGIVLKAGAIRDFLQAGVNRIISKQVR